MKKQNCMKAAVLTLIAALAIAGQLAAQNHPDQNIHTRYTVTDLGTLGGTFSQAAAINRNGRVSGSSTIAGDSAERAVVWREGVIIDLGTLGGPNSRAAADGSPNINSKGQIVGLAETSTPDPLGEQFFCGYGTGLTCVPFVWQDGVMTQLPTLGGNNGFANTINEHGQITGLAENSFHDPTCVPPQVLQFKPVFWENGMPHELATLPGDSTGEAEGNNDRGQIVGASGNDCTFSVLHPVLWNNGDPTDLGTLGGTFGAGVAVNNRTQVVGLSNLAGDVTNHAFLWTNKRGITDLGALPGDSSSLAVSINDQSQIVGVSCDINDNCRAFLVSGGKMRDLNSLVVGSPLYLSLAYNINSLGQIVGIGVTRTGEEHAFVAMPCSEDQSASCGGDTQGNATVQEEAAQRPRGAPSTRVRKMLQRLGMKLSANPTPTSQIQGSSLNEEYIRDNEMGLTIIYGLCRVDSLTNKLTGGCTGSMGLHCVGKTDTTHCPIGETAKSPGFKQLCVYGFAEVDSARTCTAL